MHVNYINVIINYFVYFIVLFISFCLQSIYDYLKRLGMAIAKRLTVFKMQGGNMYRNIGLRRWL